MSLHDKIMALSIVYGGTTIAGCGTGFADAIYGAAQIAKEADAEIYQLHERIRELRENGDRLKECADSAARHAHEMVDIVADPLRAEIIRLIDSNERITAAWRAALQADQKEVTNG